MKLCLSSYILTFASVVMPAVAVLIWCGWGCAEKKIQYTEFIDVRDDKTYKSLKMPDGKIWMVENLNFVANSSWCYDNEDSNCVKYGRLYNWETAMSACPAGWRLPSREEWNEMVSAAGGNVAGKKLKAAYGWEKDGYGMDEYGFSALPGGYRGTDGNFSSAWDFGYWWTATENGSGNAYYRGMYYGSDRAGEHYYDKGHGFSVRCIRD